MTDSKRKHPGRTAATLPRPARIAADAAALPGAPQTPLCWPFPAGSQNDTDQAVKRPPYVPPKRRTINQY